MPEFHLTHIALVGARMSAFKEYGFEDRNQLARCRVAPNTGGKTLQDVPAHELRATLKAELPVWIHNIISDNNFPGRSKMLMPLRRFEGELNDSKSDAVVVAVLSAGFKNQTLDPLNLPSAMPLPERCAMMMRVEVWQEAHRRLENELLGVLMSYKDEITDWIKQCRDPRYAAIE